MRLFRWIWRQSIAREKKYWTEVTNFVLGLLLFLALLTLPALAITALEEAADKGCLAGGSSDPDYYEDHAWWERHFVGD